MYVWYISVPWRDSHIEIQVDPGESKAPCGSKLHALSVLPVTVLLQRQVQ